MEKILMVVLIISVGVLAKPMHIHPHGHIEEEYEENNFQDYGSEEHHVVDVEGIPIEVLRDIKPQRFVPINNEYFFNRFPDCEDGLKRDILGICREVW